ncbi:PA2169 family four-helix-bundle protein [Sphingomonas sp. BN140010]|uniref:PA2169 family four-helix-bundle protein n=1 Tax=Sphingomonas arvum TaxID=2992113 RepID=A0ABT3JHK2_9SPHN|nr:PA2169 family four-helix-bundle protein [Sphingomonas sp. BN140010]MCW3798561.1 PA2169 family four-helix-bundle protein [Sphingomonas sp. BN140010]
MADTAGVGTLETLTTTLIDSINGYKDAAQNAEGSRFQELFRSMADERSKVAEDLRSEIRRLGGNPPDDGSFLGATHQRFLDLKSAITGRNDESIINEVERGEDYLKEKFETALNSQDLPADSRSVIERAYQSVRQGHDRVSSLKHGLQA